MKIVVIVDRDIGRIQGYLLCLVGVSFPFAAVLRFRLPDLKGDQVLDKRDPGEQGRVLCNRRSQMAKQTGDIQRFKRVSSCAGMYLPVHFSNDSNYRSVQAVE